MHHDRPATGEPDVELEPVGPERQPVIEGGQRILGPERRAAAVGVNQRKRHGR